MTHKKFVKSIARQYFNVYRTLGYDEAKEYADRMIKKDEKLREEVAEAVGNLFAPQKGGS